MPNKPKTLIICLIITVIFSIGLFQDVLLTNFIPIKDDTYIESSDLENTRNVTTETLYGKTKIIGLNGTFTNITDIAVAGMFHTGTHAIYNLLHGNCFSNSNMKQNKYIKKIISYGKHTMISKHILMQYWNKIETKLIVTMIKDPLTWIKSICHRRYGFEFFDQKWFHKDCPKNIKLSALRYRIERDLKNTTYYASLVHFWNEFYWKYVYIDTILDLQRDIHINRLIIRFEDILFNTMEVINNICHCAHGKFDKKVFDFSEERAKNIGRNRSEALVAYSNPAFRYQGYTYDDLVFFNNTLNHELLVMFGYSLYF